MNECKKCKELCELLLMLIGKRNVSMEEVDVAIEATERLLKVLKTYKESC